MISNFTYTIVKNTLIVRVFTLNKAEEYIPDLIKTTL